MFTLRTFIIEDNPEILDRLTVMLEDLADVTVVGSAGAEGEALES